MTPEAFAPVPARRTQAETKAPASPDRLLMTLRRTATDRQRAELARRDRFGRFGGR